MKKLVMVLFITVLLTTAVKGGIAEEQFDPSRLERALPEHSRGLLRADSAETPLLQRMTALLQRGIREADKSVPSAIRCAIRILLVAALLSAIRSMEISRMGPAVSLAGSATVTAVFAGDLNAMLLLGQRTVEELSDFSKLLIPTMASAAAVSGACGASAVIGSLTTVLMQVFVSLMKSLVLPLSGIYVALCTAASGLEQESLQGLADAVGGFMKRGIRIILFVFTAGLSLSGVLSEASDAAAMRAAKLTISASVPVAGNVLSDAASSVLAGAKVLLQSVGVYGMLGVFAIVVVPFLRLGFQYLLLQFTGFCCGALGETQSQKLVHGLSSATGCLLAATAGCGVMVLVSCVCLIRLRVI